MIHTRDATRAFGLMFHYFHDGSAYRAAQGSLAAEEFDSILGEFRASGRLLDALEWGERAERNELQDQVCVTLDDGLQSQVDVALPVLRRHGVTAFWFPQSGIFTGESGTLEPFRRFRNEFFATVDDFYAAFFGAASSHVQMRSFEVPPDYLQSFSFYSQEDRLFRYMRDHVLRPEEYVSLTTELIRRAGTSVEELSAGLFITSDTVRALEAAGHVIGLHSHSHPTMMAALEEERQREEYERNFTVLSGLLDATPSTVAHPNGSYGPATLRILQRLGVRLGFRSNMDPCDNSLLELPREDSATLHREMTHACGPA